MWQVKGTLSLSVCVRLMKIYTFYSLHTDTRTLTHIRGFAMRLGQIASTCKLEYVHECECEYANECDYDYECECECEYALPCLTKHFE